MRAVAFKLNADNTVTVYSGQNFATTSKPVKVDYWNLIELLEAGEVAINGEVIKPFQHRYQCEHGMAYHGWEGLQSCRDNNHRCGIKGCGKAIGSSFHIKEGQND